MAGSSPRCEIKAGSVRLAAVALAAVVLLPALGPPGNARAATVENLALLSGPSPFAGNCGLEGSFDPGREGSSHVAVDPADPDRIVVAWGQHRQEAGGWLGIVTASTTDGGETWTRSTLPTSTRCTGGEHPHAVDPWVGFGPDGVAYVASIATTIRPLDAGGLPSPAYLAERGAVLVHRSHNGGASWSAPFAVDPDDLGTLEDRDALTPDPHDAQRLYLAWGKFVGAIPGPNLLFFSRSDDGGRTFSEGRPIYVPRAAAVLGVETLVLAGGDLVVVFAEIDVPAFLEVTGAKIRAIRSSDGGATWSSPADIGEYCFCTARDAETGAALASAFPTPSAGVSGDGTLFVGWVDRLADEAYAISVSRSRDGGRTWDAPMAAAHLAAPAMLPTLAVGGAGDIALMWYDIRNDVAGDAQTTADWWIAHSGDAGATWAETHLAGPFDLRATTDPGGSTYRLGDYFGLASVPGGFVAAIVQAGPQAADGPTDVFFARIWNEARRR